MDRPLNLRQTWILVIFVTIAGDGVLWLLTYDWGTVLLITIMNIAIGLLGTYLMVKPPNDH